MSIEKIWECLMFDNFKFPGFNRKSKEEMQETKPPNNIEEEITKIQFERSFRMDMMDVLANPSKVIQYKGFDFLKEVASDGAYHSCYTLKNYARLSTPWQVIPYSEDREDVKVADFVDFCLRNIRGNFRDKLEEVYSAMTFGFSVSEILFRKLETGEWAGKIGLKDIKTRDPEFIDFSIDEYGNMKAILQDDILGGGKPIKLPMEKAIVYTHNGQFGNPYGTPDVIYIYKNYIAKKWILKFWNVAIERYGSSIPVGTFPDGRDDIKKQLDEMFKDMQNRSGFTIPESATIEFHQPLKGKGNPFSEAMEKHNKMISRALLLPDQTGFVETNYGSYAKAKTEFDIFMLVLNKLKRKSEEVVKEQLIRRLVNYNFGPDVPTPRFEFQPMSKDDKYDVFKTFTSLIKHGAITPTEEDEKYARKVLELPEKQEAPEGEEEATKSHYHMNGNPYNMPGATELQENIEEQFDSVSNGKIKFKEMAQKGEEVTQDTGRPSDDTAGVRAFNKERVSREWDALDESATKQLQKVVGKMKARLMSDIQKKNLAGPDANPKQIRDLKMHYDGEFRRTLAKWLVIGHLTAKRRALMETKQAGRLPKELEKYSREDYQSIGQGYAGTSLAAMLDMNMEEAVAHFEGKVPIVKKELEFYTNKAFTITGAETEELLKECKMVLLNNLERGEKGKAMAQLQKVFEKYEVTGAVSQAGELKTAHRLETIVRTNMSEAINRGRYYMWQNSPVKKMIVGYRTTAILDDRTTDYCLSIHGQVWRRDAFVPPPYHYNCRTTYTPIYKDEPHTFATPKPNPNTDSFGNHFPTVARAA